MATPTTNAAPAAAGLAARAAATPSIIARTATASCEAAYDVDQDQRVQCDKGGGAERLDPAPRREPADDQRDPKD